MFDFGILSGAAIAAAVAHFSGKAADGAASSLGGKVVDWIKHKLTDPAERGALDKLAAEPASDGARRTLEGMIFNRLQSNSDLALGLADLLRQGGIAQNASGGSIQVALKGDGVQTVSINTPSARKR
jgi:hypothetical protein